MQVPSVLPNRPESLLEQINTLPHLHLFNRGIIRVPPEVLDGLDPLAQLFEVGRVVLCAAAGLLLLLLLLIVLMLVKVHVPVVLCRQGAHGLHEVDFRIVALLCGGVCAGALG
jgi:hypothetical protein